jgi:hypothetical protein
LVHFEPPAEWIGPARKQDAPRPTASPSGSPGLDTHLLREAILAQDINPLSEELLAALSWSDWIFANGKQLRRQD